MKSVARLVRIIAVALFSVMVMSPASLSAQDDRNARRINDDWTFRFASQVSGKGERVDLPHTWNASDALSGDPAYRRTTGVYEKRLKYDPSWKGRRVILRFEGAQGWLRRLCGRHHRSAP